MPLTAPAPVFAQDGLFPDPDGSLLERRDLGCGEDFGFDGAGKQIARHRVQLRKRATLAAEQELGTSLPYSTG